MDYNETTADAGKVLEKRDLRDTIEIIAEQSRQTLELARMILGALMAQTPEREGPPLEQLIAYLVALQREAIALGKTNLASTNQLRATLPEAVVEAITASRAIGGTGRPC